LVNVMVPDGEAGRPRGALLIGRVLAKPITQRKRKQLAAVLRELGANTAAIDVGRAVPVVPKADLLLSALIARNLLELERLSLPKQPTRPSASALCSSARALRHQRICRQIQQIIERDYRQPLSSAQLAAAVNLTPNYLCSIFHETTGIRLGAYITAVRVEKSQQWLAQAGVHVKEAAYQAGFADPNYFAVVFKKITGLTPTQWRARHDEKVLRDGGSVATS
jgi:AraC-like DNA-binding protein